MCWRNPYEGLHAGKGHLPGGDGREAPTIGRSFLSGETSRNLVFVITHWHFRNVIAYGFGDVSVSKNPKIEYPYIVVVSQKPQYAGNLKKIIEKQTNKWNFPLTLQYVLLYFK